MPNNFNIFDCISGRLGKLKRQVNAIYRKHLAPTGMTESQTMILLTLLELKSIEQIKMAKVFSLEKSSLSRNLVRLQKMGYLMKSDDYHPTLSLTKEGHRFAKILQPIWENAMHEAKDLIGEDGVAALALLESKV